MTRRKIESRGTIVNHRPTSPRASLYPREKLQQDDFIRTTNAHLNIFRLQRLALPLHPICPRARVEILPTDDTLDDTTHCHGMGGLASEERNLSATRACGQHYCTWHPSLRILSMYNTCCRGTHGHRPAQVSDGGSKPLEHMVGRT
jgi:hypothetical protein